MEKSKIFQLLSGVFLISFTPIFVKIINMGPGSIGFYRCLMAALLLCPFVMLEFIKNPALKKLFNKKFFLIGLLTGSFFSIDLFFWHHSVINLGAGMSTVLGNTQAIYVAVFGIFIDKEKLTPRFVSSLVLSFCGLLILFSERPDWILAQNFSWGIACGVFTGFAYAGYIICLRRLELHAPQLSSSLKMMIVSFFTCIFLAPLCLALAKESLIIPSWMDFIKLVALAISGQALGWILISQSLPKIASAKSGLVLLLQPVFAMFLGLIIFAENLTLIQYAGSILTLIGIYVGMTRRKKFSFRNPA